MELHLHMLFWLKGIEGEEGAEQGEADEEGIENS